MSSQLVSFHVLHHPVHVYSRREGHVRRRDDENPIGLDQSRRVTRHHAQAEQELPRCGAAGTPDADCLSGREKKTHTFF